ncbi:EAL domain-containing response regulator [Nitrosomonas ureae]|uniref:EAL domain, c-di-GMP-specific phosphodiesterase class I (Or its enzymatically inactive variant) n=1 Tax=Nitrosomonas ureae TaxID=44577 RepID=A0A1H2FW64_9PROT|nr:EAL domain-containing response regulator [Nitrosomonas ureae]ALQ51600.1 histidine kinase [Nitrosomonas ureae]SDU11573.1 EAL domain, c-di-GMP-specific phosphodiesterase class I (or its enzymatically inactive variant) [Nitrosomonas ureae]
MVSASNVKIMILDDDTFMLKLLTRMLAKLGYTSVITCDNGSDALRKIDHIDTRPDLILLDLNMPDMDGIEFVRYLVDRQYHGKLILVSGEDERMLKTAERLVHAHKISMLGYLLKPVNPEKLSEILQQWEPDSSDGQLPIQKIYTAADIQSALAHHELVNYYQPKVSVATGDVIGAETLVRWHHPKEGIILPDRFIHIAEENNLIDDLTHQVLQQAIAQAKQWDQNGLSLRIGINVSMDNLASLDFQDFVVNLVNDNGLPPQKIVLEVTESQLMGTDTRIPLEILTRLRLKRFHLSIDDFGTGHSSLAQLRDIPFNELKIDQGFVHRAREDDTLRAIYDASLSMGKQLGMDIVAEGVEDRNDWELLRETGCDMAQGNFISGPLLPDDFLLWMNEWQNKVHTELIVAPE